MAKSSSRSRGGSRSSSGTGARSGSSSRSRGGARSKSRRGGKWVSPATKNTLKEIGKNAAIAAVQTVAQKAARGSTIKRGGAQASKAQSKKRGASSRSRSR